MKISMEKLIQSLVARGTATARQTLPKSDERVPMSIRLAPRTRHFLEAQAEALNTSVQAVISIILDGVTEASMDATGAELRTIRERFLVLCDAHDLGLPEIVELMKDFGFTLSALGSTDRLLDLLTSEAIARLADLFRINPEWLMARSDIARGNQLAWYKNLGASTRRLLQIRDAREEPTLLLIRQAGADFARAYRDNDEDPAIKAEPIGAVLRQTKMTPSGKRFVSYDVWQFERWNYWRCRQEMKYLIAFCEQASIGVHGYELSPEDLKSLIDGRQLPVTLLRRMGPVAWYPATYARIDGEVTEEREEWLGENGSGFRDSYLQSALPAIAAGRLQ